MKIGLLFLLFLSSMLISCRQPVTVKSSDYLLLFTDSLSGESGYKDQNGKVIIPAGKYIYCTTDTFRTFAIVCTDTGGFIGIDREEKVLYKIFPFDNGADYPSNGLFRIIENDKIGYADEKTGKIIIKPQFDCAYPFENGRAQVSTDCKTVDTGDHRFWESDNWYYIDTTGTKVDKPASK